MTTSEHTTVLIDDVVNNRDSWLEARKGKIGGSDIAAICGLNKWRSPLQVWSEMTGRVPAQQEENDAMWLGRVMEPIVAEMFTRNTGFSTSHCNKMYGSTDIPWAIATPDYFFSIDNSLSLLECKTTGGWAAEQWQDGKVPDSYHIQLMWQMGITGIHKGELACLIGGREFVHTPFDFEPQIFEQLVEIGENFMKKVQEDTPPQALPEDEMLLMQISGGIDLNKSVDFTESSELVNAASSYHRLSELYKKHQKAAREAKEEMEQLETLIRQEMKSAGVATLGKFIASQKHKIRKPFWCKQSEWIEFSLRENEE